MKKEGGEGINGNHKIFILGLPNTGKTTLFNGLTGSYGVVANYPLTTIDTKRANLLHKKKTFQIVDTPGLHGLFIYSEEELFIRKAIFSEKPDIIIQCIDLNRLKQSLFLTSDLMELKIPMILALNFAEETGEAGIVIDSGAFSEFLQIPVVELGKNIGAGLRELKSVIEKASVPKNSPLYPPWVLEKIISLEAVLPSSLPYRTKTAMLLLQQDPFHLSEIQTIDKNLSVESISKPVKTSLKISGAIRNQRDIWVEMVSEKIRKVYPGVAKRTTFLEKLAHYSRHPLLGLPMLGIFLLLSYLSIVNIANLLSRLLAAFLIDPATGYLTRIIPAGFIQDFLIGSYGILTLGLFNAVGTVLPVLTVFFFFFGLVEDIGYLPNLTVLVKRFFEKIGLSGKSLMSLVLGFGCKTMATLTTKSIISRKEKLIAVFLIGFAIPCSAQLGLNIAILGRAGLSAMGIAFFFLFLVEIGAGIILNKLIKEDRKTAFIQELSSFRAPRIKPLLKKTGFRLYWFLKESVLIFIIAAAVLFLLDFSGVLILIKKLLNPLIVSWLGLPINMVDALILTMARHEAGAGLILKMSGRGMLNPIQSIIAVVITTMFVPCLANIVAMIKETGIKTGLMMTLAINISAYALAGLLNWVLNTFFTGVLL